MINVNRLHFQRAYLELVAGSESVDGSVNGILLPVAGTRLEGKDFPLELSCRPVLDCLEDQLACLPHVDWNVLVQK